MKMPRLMILIYTRKQAFNFPHPVLKNGCFQYACAFAAKSTFLAVNVRINIGKIRRYKDIFVLRLTIR
jgi:hypothetical protein